MIGSIVRQLSEDVDIDEIKKHGFDSYYVDHGLAVYPSSASGVPFTAAYLQSKGDPITDLYEDMAAEQKARSTYEYILNLTDDPDVAEPIKFLREREIVHFQRFGEALRIVQDYMDSKRCFVMPKIDCIKPDSVKIDFDKSDCKKGNCIKPNYDKNKCDCKKL